MGSIRELLLASRRHAFRQEAWSRAVALLQPDVVIFGGGVNGAAVLRDLALNGLTAVLVEQGDFCKGASGASTRMAHGGLRYLERREFSLVAEAARERDLLLTHAAHAAVPLPIVLPVEHLATGFIGSVLNFLGIVQRRVPLSLLSAKLALSIYERTGRANRRLPGHDIIWSRGGGARQLGRRFKAKVLYHDGRLRYPEGLVFEMLEEAMAVSDQITALNHVDWRVADDGDLRVTDGVTKETVRLRPRVVVNATGAWLDRTNARLGFETDHVSAVRGAHLVIRHDVLLRRLDGQAYYFDDGAGRMVICCPLERTVLMGTTEIPSSDADQGRIDQEEVAYLRCALSSLFDDIEIEDQHIIAVTTGARPLKKSGGDAYAASRGHVIQRDHARHGTWPVLSMIGGKWTTFRTFAEQTTDSVLRELAVARTLSTADRGYRGTPEPGMAERVAGDAVSERLFARYGAVADEIRAYCQEAADPELESVPDYSRREIAWLILQRGAVHLDDILLRRTTIALDGWASDDALTEIAGILGEVTGRDDAWVRDEIVRCRTLGAIRWPAESERAVAAAS